MKVVLFCGGRGTRMRAAGDSTPKPLALVGGEPLIWHQMQWYAHYGHTEFVLCLGYAAADIDGYLAGRLATVSEASPGPGVSCYRGVGADCAGWRITTVQTGADTPIGERLRRVRRFIGRDEVFLANYSDVLTDVRLDLVVRQFLAGPAVGALLAVHPPLTLHTLALDGDRVVAIRPYAEHPTWINGGFFVLRRQIFDVLIPGQDLAGDAFPRLAELGQLQAITHSGFWHPADEPRERDHLDELYREDRAPWAVWTHAGEQKVRIPTQPTRDPATVDA